MIREDGIQRCGFLTLTVGDTDADGHFRQVWDAAEASRRVNSLNTALLSKLFHRAILVTERHKSGAIHFHLIGSLASGADIRSGFDWEAVSRGDYRSVSPELRTVWAMLRERLPGFGFGRAELTPIKKTGGAIASYVAKYVEKNLFHRTKDDRRKKLVRYLGWKGLHLTANAFSWATPGAILWRQCAEAIASVEGIETRSQAAEQIGPRWAWRFSKLMHADVTREDVSMALRHARIMEIRRQAPEAFERPLSPEEWEELQEWMTQERAWQEAHGFEYAE